MNDPTANTLEKPSDLGMSPRGVADRWKLELKLSDKREEEWRKCASAIYKQYTPSNPAANSFNILWTNTETLRQAVYNSLPQPDARRRYQDEDPLGKSVAEVLTRALEFSQDTYDFDAVLKGDTLAMLLPGRAVSRVRYVPDIRSVGQESDEDSDEEAQEGESYEEIEWESVICERVQWNDFRILCAAKTWDEVTAIAFRHRMSREDCVEKFGADIGNALPLDAAEDEDIKNSKDGADLFKTAEIWEIWDKDKKQVIWICKTYATPCKTQEDPLQLSGFFCVPRPLYAIENDSSLVPSALYTQYEQQAKELNIISQRINKLMTALKVRGIYDSTLGEISELMKGNDNDLIPAQNVTALLERGGLDKAIWMMPIDSAAMVIKELYIQRDSCKQIIYEITGISDIMRSATDAGETFGAQKIKTQWGTQRLQRMQREVQRYIRDLIRLKAEIIAEKFQPETLEKMTLVQLPHQADVDQANQQAMMQYQQHMQQMQMQPQQPGQPPMQMGPPPQPAHPITWEAVMDAMRDDATRTYRIDIETDSTLSASQDSDMQGLKDLMTGLSGLMQAFGPAIQQGAMDIGMLREMMLVVCRRARMGTAVEDVISKMKQPPPPSNPEDGKAQMQMQIEQGKGQLAMQLEQSKGQAAMQLEQMKSQLQDTLHQRQIASDLQAEQGKSELQMQLQAHEQEVQAQQNQHQNELESAREVQKAQLTAELAAQQREHDAVLAQSKQDFDRWKVEYENNAKMVMAEMQINASMKQAAITSNSANKMGASKVNETTGASEPNSDLASLINSINSNMSAMLDASDAKHKDLITVITKPKTIVRDANGKAQGIS